MPSPRFSWKLPARLARGTAQAAYRLTVGAWDSGVVHSANTVLVSYTGPPLLPDTFYGWSVAWSNGTHEALPTRSEFHTGLFAPADWQGAQFLGNSTHGYLAAFFDAPAGPIARVMAYVAAVGGFALQVNGVAVGDQFGVSAWAQSNLQIYYQALNVPPTLFKVDERL